MDKKLIDLFKEEKLICPDSRKSWFSEVALCNLNDKYCLLEEGLTCVHYEDWLKEVQ